MQVNGLNSSAYHWKMQLQNRQNGYLEGMTNAFQTMRNSYINSESTQNLEEIPEKKASSFNMMPLMMQLDSVSKMQDETSGEVVSA